MKAALLCCLFVCSALLLVSVADARKPQCEVCEKAVNDFIAYAKEKKLLSKDHLEVEKGIKAVCKGYAHGAKERKFCDNVGGTPEAGSYILRSISTPMKNGLPADKICKQLSKMDHAVCELRFSKASADEAEAGEESKPKEKKPKTSGPVDLNKMRLKELKALLREWGVQCVGCMSKEDYMYRVKELAPKYDSETLYFVEEPKQYKGGASEEL